MASSGRPRGTFADEYGSFVPGALTFYFDEAIMLLVV